MADQPDPPAGFATISELARLRGVDKSGLSRRVSRLAGQGLLSTRAGPRKTLLVNVSEFDRVARETTDAVRALNGASGGSPSPADDPAPGDPVLAKEQARRTKADADLKELDRDERIRQLVRETRFERRSLRL
jgi:DNA-binding MarR family transcriptional regulator